jgi:hypothetical protein
MKVNTPIIVLHTSIFEGFTSVFEVSTSVFEVSTSVFEVLTFIFEVSTSVFEVSTSISEVHSYKILIINDLDYQKAPQKSRCFLHFRRCSLRIFSNADAILCENS